MNKFKRTLIYIVSIAIFIVLSVEIGAELVTQYTMYTSDYTDSERYKLADDMGFGILLMFWLIPEVIFGSVVGSLVAKKINSKLYNQVAGDILQRPQHSACGSAHD